jgi:hypothetical protein
VSSIRGPAGVLSVEEFNDSNTNPMRTFSFKSLTADLSDSNQSGEWNEANSPFLVLDQAYLRPSLNINSSLRL